MLRACSYLSRARANRERAEAIREAARESVKQMLKEKRRSGNRERANDHLVTDAKARLLESNRREVAAVYKRRFVGREEEHEWESSPLRRLQQRRSARGASSGWGPGRSSASARAGEVYL